MKVYRADGNEGHYLFVVRNSGTIKRTILVTQFGAIFSSFMTADSRQSVSNVLKDNNAYVVDKQEFLDAFDLAVKGERDLLDFSLT